MALTKVQGEGINGISITSGGVVTMASTTFAQAFRLTANLTANGDLTNWEACDDASSGASGTAITVSSGHFTFPITGLYKIDYFYRTFNQSSAQDNFITLDLFHSSNSGSDFDQITESSSGGTDDMSASGCAMALVNITNASTHRVKLVGGSLASGSKIEGSSVTNTTAIVFQRLTDSQ
tara:strand:+ start:933 stop:1469 length:537 start_codon:yes stop_codon:yes gene_type:complete